MLIGDLGFGVIFAGLGIIYLLAVAIPLARTDIREFRLPNRLVLPAIPIALFGQLLASALTNQWHRVAWSMAISLAVFVCTVLISLRGLMGMGDAKLITAIALCLAWFDPTLPLLAILTAFVLASGYLLFRLARKKVSRGETLALGPYLLIGFALASSAQLVLLRWPGH